VSCCFHCVCEIVDCSVCYGNT